MTTQQDSRTGSANGKADADGKRPEGAESDLQDLMDTVLAAPKAKRKSLLNQAIFPVSRLVSEDGLDLLVALREVTRVGEEIGLDRDELGDLAVQLVRGLDVPEPSQNGKGRGKEWERVILPEPEWPQLGEDAYYGLVGEVVRTLAPHTEADPVGLLAHCLGHYGNCVGLGPHIRISADRHTAKHFINLVGKSARARKDMARVEIKRLYSLVDPDWAGQRQVRGLGSGEGLIEKVKDPPPPKVNGPTPETEDEEGMVVNNGDIFSENDDEVIKRGWKSLEPDVSVDKRYMVVESEFGRLLTIAQREGSILAPVICMAWDGDVLDITTKKFSAHGTNVHVSLTANITLEGLRRQLTKAEALEGFGNRYLYFLVQKSKKLPRGGDLPQSELNALARKLRAAIRRARKITGEVGWSDEALALWDRYYDEMDQDEPGGLLGGIVARNQAQCLRLALTYALMDVKPDGAVQIELAHVKAAKAVWDYCRASAAYIFGDNTGDDVAERIRARLVETDPEPLDRDAIYRDLFSKNESKDRLDAALATLMSMGVIEIFRQKTGKPGRPPEYVYLAGRHEATI